MPEDAARYPDFFYVLRYRHQMLMIIKHLFRQCILTWNKAYGATIEPGEDNNLDWWVDSSYAVDLDMRSHSGIIMTLGNGAIYTASTKQKINEKILQKQN